MVYPNATSSPVTMKPIEIDFKAANVYDGEKLDLINAQGGHDYCQKLQGIPTEIEHIIKLLKRIIRYCHSINANNSPRWTRCQEAFIFDSPGWKAWDTIVNRDYPNFQARNNNNLLDEMIPKVLDEILRSEQNSVQIYDYIARLTWNSDQYEIIAWTDRLLALYDVADTMTALSRPSVMQRLQHYTRSIGGDYMDSVTLLPGMNDIYDRANNGAQPVPIRTIASSISRLQVTRNKSKGLKLNDEKNRYVKKNDNGGGGNGGASGSRKRNNDGGYNGGNRNNDQRRKKPRGNGNHQNNNGQGRTDYGNQACKLPGHGGHNWKDCFLNYQNKGKYNHESAVRMAGRDNAPDWFKAQVARSTKFRENNGGNNGGNNGNESYHVSQGNYQQGGNSSYQGQGQYQQQQQQPPPQHHTYMQFPPPPHGAPPAFSAPRGPGRNDPPSAPPSSGNGRWVYQQF
eukprot:scaffold12715_cov134-Skeletonema_dohrnii-CCMP3373.AAC.1